MEQEKQREKQEEIQKRQSQNKVITNKLRAKNHVFHQMQPLIHESKIFNINMDN